MGKNKFDAILEKVMKIRGVKINRENFLNKELSNYFSEDIVKKAVQDNPAIAGIEVAEINKIADKVIAYEIRQSTFISTIIGIPGGIAVAGTIAIDITQYLGHIIRITQKLAYLYGWKDMFDENEELSKDTIERMTLLMGVMFGVDLADNAVVKLAQSAALNIEKKILQKALTRSAVYPIIKKAASILGIRISQQSFSIGVSKSIPYIGGIISGIVTYITMKPLALNLQEALSELPLADISFYKNK
ncbi:MULTISPECIES: hypothetical protein [Fusobacterium]|jgi:hypothetical protein|uniref:EcsC family protein n=2 Tax=Fusobacterium varium TaxID=856 RepID=A0ABN5JJT3_FUSVA|nr:MULTISPECIES: hypothetical protein [Fusobacterium]AVQ32438.1 hypothetical protein C4N18_14820 [Fusobacterium varium ATCC 27725]EES64376.1 hypothetical protein FVAG_01867 [Fusobacterium varium ATCC 27725]MCF0169846.1 hypothetical protein [Fusobacterium varium]MCF2672364.1 hypothetical protein [Fusobacterium varium]MCI6031862.1 hypothetical protein [Fusobacterium varium]